MTKILVALYEKAEQAQQTAQQLSNLGIAQNEIGVLPGQGSSSTAGLLADARSGAPLIRKLAEIGVPQEQAELYAQGREHGLGFVLARVENDHAEQAGQVMEHQPVINIEARAEQWASQGEQEQTVQAIEEELHVSKRAYELMRSLIAADENYQEEFKLYSESLGAAGVRRTIEELLEAAPIK